jgi:hypothetical protein
MFGYGALYSDVQVTFPDGTTKDLIQKAYPITNFIAAGFSGSVRVGFSLLQSLAECTLLPDDALKTQAWDPVWVAKRWAPVAKSVFESAPQVERTLGASMLLLGASPNENAGLGARMFLVRFASPDFRPGIMARFIMWCSIGTGAGVAEYKQRIKPHIRFVSGIHRAEIMNPNGWAQELVFSLTRSLREQPRPGISRHLHAVVVRRGQVSTWNNDEKIHYPDGSVEDVRMPPVAQNYEQFLQLAAAAGADGACATC